MGASAQTPEDRKTTEVCPEAPFDPRHTHAPALNHKHEQSGQHCSVCLNRGQQRHAQLLLNPQHMHALLPFQFTNLSHQASIVASHQGTAAVSPAAPQSMTR
eukprot:scaffold127510_cov20-Tisochrysis_lutea.AAC.3